MKKVGKKLTTLERVVALLRHRKRGLTAKAIASKLKANPHTVRRVLGAPSDPYLVRAGSPAVYEYSPAYADSITIR